MMFRYIAALEFAKRKKYTINVVSELIPILIESHHRFWVKLVSGRKGMDPVQEQILLETTQ